jgi:hypothetical protein
MMMAWGKDPEPRAGVRRGLFVSFHRAPRWIVKSSPFFRSLLREFLLKSKMPLAFLS